MFTSIVKAHIMTVLLTLFVGTLSYYAYGNDVMEIILYNLPNDATFTVVTQIFYMLNIFGCFVLQAQVVFNLSEK